MSSVDELEALWRPAAVVEVCELMKTLRPSEMTGCELVGLLAILRSAMARVYPNDEAAPVLQLVPRAVRNRKQPVPV